MQAPVSRNWLVYARKAFTTYSSWQRVTGPKNWPKGTPFRIREIIRAGSTIWVRSDAAGWAIFDNSLFEDANCHYLSRVYLSPGRPADNRPLHFTPTSGALYAAELTDEGSNNSNGMWRPRHVQTAV